MYHIRTLAFLFLFFFYVLFSVVVCLIIFLVSLSGLRPGW